MTTKRKKDPINIRQLSKAFEEHQPLCVELHDTALVILKKILIESPIKIHSIPTRIKTLPSFLEKVRRYHFEQPFDQIEDVVGLRVICLFLSDIEKIVRLVQANFDVVRDDDKVANASFSTFGYMSRHLIARLGDNYARTIYSSIKDLRFEIQVRTIAMDAWANISHYLEYKKDQDIPEELKRDFYTLSGMFYVADRHFQLFFEEREEKQEEISNVLGKGKKAQISAQPLNLDTLSAFLRMKFPDRKSQGSESYSQLLDQLLSFGLETIGELEAELDRSVEACYQWETQQQSGKAYLADVGVVRIALSILHEEFDKKRLEQFPIPGKGMEQRLKKSQSDFAPFTKYVKD